MVSTEINNLYLGGTQCSAAYYGSVKIYPSDEPEPTYPASSVTVFYKDGTSATTVYSTGSIPNSAYTGGTIVKVIMTNGIKTIGRSAFRNQTYLADIYFPSTITMINNDSIRNTGPNTTNTYVNFHIPSLSWWLTVGRGTSYPWARHALLINNSIVTMPQIPNVSSLPDFCFFNDLGVEYIIIPDTVTSIGTYFAQGSSVKEIYTGGVSALTNSFAYECKQLEKLTLGSAVTSIGTNAFGKCTKLSNIVSKNLTAPTVTNTTFGSATYEFTGRDTYSAGTNTLYIYSGATGYTSSYWSERLLHRDYCGFHTEYINENVKNNEILYTTTDGKVLEDYPRLFGYTAKDSTGYTIIGAIVLENYIDSNGIGHIVCDTDITFLQNNIFSNNDQLLSMTLPPSVTKITSCTFRKCPNLESLTLYGQIGNNVAELNHNLTELHIHNCSSIGYSILCGNSGLTDIYFYDDTEPAYESFTIYDTSGLKENGTIHYREGADYSTWINGLSYKGWTGVADIT